MNESNLAFYNAEIYPPLPRKMAQRNILNLRRKTGRCLVCLSGLRYMSVWALCFLIILLITASDLASITSHIHSWVFFLLWLHPFILSGVISPLISSSILGTYWPGEFLFQYHLQLFLRLFKLFLSFHIFQDSCFPSPSSLLECCLIL